MESNTEKGIEEISRKMDVMIGVLLDISSALNDKILTKEKVVYLAERGLSNKDISRILGVSEKYVSKEKSLNKPKQDDPKSEEVQDGREETI